MQHVLVGSSALAQYFPEKVTPKDHDYFVDSPEVKENIPKAVDGLRVESFYHPRLFDWAWSGTATLDELYTIKVSHAFWVLRNGSWKKHMFYLTLMQHHGATFIPELYDLLYPVWVETHGAKKANLEATPEQFFNNNVTRVYDHDSIHASVAYYDEPLFNRILRDDSEVAVSREKFEQLSHDDKLKLVREEVYATALERQGIPSNYKKNYRSAYNYALMQTITSFTKGWFPLFIVLNFKELRQPDHNYYKTHRANMDKLQKLV